MGDDASPQDLQLTHIITRDHEEKLVRRTGGSESSTNLPELFLDQDPNVLLKPERGRPYWWWLKVGIYSFLVLSSQSVATLLGRQYYDKGGSSKWLATLVQLCGFPTLIPYYFIFSSTSHKKHLSHNIATADQVPRASESQITPGPSLRTLTWVYVSLGSLVAADCYLYSVGLQYLPVSTYSLICASQLAFNALFSFFLNSQKFTPFIINSLVLLTISSVLLVFQTGSENPSGVSKVEYVIGFVCTLGASAGYALQLSLTQLCFKKVIKKETFRAVMDMILFQNMVATLVIVVALFASGEWKHLTAEMEGYTMGKVSYVMNLVWTGVSWQLFSIGSTGLIFDASSLFSNAISVLGLPIVPVFAVVFFHDTMDGVKVVSMVLAIWGFVSYGYEHYLGDSKSKNEAERDIRSNTSIPSQR